MDLENRTLLTAVREITGNSNISECEARVFASEQYGVLAAYIRSRFVDNIVNKQQIDKAKELIAANKARRLKMLEDYRAYKVTKTTRNQVK